MGTAQFGAWSAWASTIGLVVFSTLKLWRYHSEENMRVSMAIARERLVKNAASIATTNGGGDGDGPSSSTKNNAKTNLRNGGNPTTSSASKRGKDKEGNDPAIHSI